MQFSNISRYIYKLATQTSKGKYMLICSLLSKWSDQNQNRGAHDAKL